MQTSTRAKILLADDDHSVRDALGDLLDSEGFEVVRVANGHEALVKFCEQHTDIAILDMMMPVKGGAETSIWLRSMAPLLPIIVITARPDAHRAMLSAGAVLLQKPVHIPVLLKAIRDLLASRQIAHSGERSTFTQPLGRQPNDRHAHSSRG